MATAPVDCYLGFDFGTASVRGVLVDAATGVCVATGVCEYAHGDCMRAEDGTHRFAGWPLDGFAVQHADDWLNAAASVCEHMHVELESGCNVRHVIQAIGVAFTSCTALPCLRDGTPLFLQPGGRWADHPHAWPKLWKHHSPTVARASARMTAHARETAQPWLARYGGQIGLEWLFPKAIEISDDAPDVFDATEVFLEAGDWLVWQLCAGPWPHAPARAPVRSQCNAGYKGCWSPSTGYPSEEFCAGLHAKLPALVREKLWGELRPAGAPAGQLAPAAASRLGLASPARMLCCGTSCVVATGMIDAHAGVLGVGVREAGTLVSVLGTSACHMLMANNVAPIHALDVTGIAGEVENGIIPGMVGMETGQAAVGDALTWVAETTQRSHAELLEAAVALPPGAHGIICIDWHNGCRTPLMDGRLKAAYLGITLQTTPAQLYRATLEGTAFGLRRIVGVLTRRGAPVETVVLSGGLPQRHHLTPQIYADVLNRKVSVPACAQPVALGAAVLAGVAHDLHAGGRPHSEADDATYASAFARVMGRLHSATAWKHYSPCPDSADAYDALYALYATLAGEGVKDAATACTEAGSFSGSLVQALLALVNAPTSRKS